MASVLLHRRNEVALLVALLLVVLPTLGDAWGHSLYGSPFGHFGERYGGNPYSHRGSGLDSYFDSFPGHSSKQPPCPQYKSMEASSWKDTADGRQVAYVTLPGVRSGNHRIWLEDNGIEIAVGATRPLPARRHCLPRQAQISADGGAEILQTVVRLPAGVDGARATARQVRGGLEISVPKLPARSSWKDVRDDLPASQRKGGSRQQAGYTVPQPPSRILTRDTAASKPVANSVQPSSPAKAAPRPPAMPVAWKVALPPSDGIELVEEDFPFPAKLPDASEGWLDNRGEFQYY